MVRCFAAAATGLMLTLAVAACGESPQSPTAPPPDHLLKVAASAPLTDFRITYSGHREALGAGQRPFAAPFAGSGSVALGQPLRAELTETNGFCASECRDELVVIGQDRYTRNVSGVSWWLDHGITLDSYVWALILPSRLALASSPSVIGKANVNGDAAWIVEATDPAGHSFRVWLRLIDDYPLRYESAPNDKTTFLDIRIVLDSFNRGVDVVTPAKDQLSPQLWGTSFRREQPIPVGAGSVTVHNPKFDCSGGDLVDDSNPDAYPVLVGFTYVARERALTINPSAWAVYDEALHSYHAQPLGTAAKLTEQTLPANQTTSGSLCFSVPWTQDRITLIGTLNGELVSVFLGGLRRPDQTGLP